jgi:hypothetical protein
VLSLTLNIVHIWLERHKKKHVLRHFAKKGFHFVSDVFRFFGDWGEKLS